MVVFWLPALKFILASSKLGGPKVPLASLEKPQGSDGIPKKLVSRFSFAFSLSDLFDTYKLDLPKFGQFQIFVLGNEALLDENGNLYKSVYIDYLPFERCTKDSIGFNKLNESNFDLLGISS